MKYRVSMDVELEEDNKDKNLELAIESALDEYGIYANNIDVYAVED